LNCLNCGKEIKSEDATFCPYCAKPVHLHQNIAKKRSGYSLTAGILTIISSCISMGIGLLYVLLVSTTLRYYPSGSQILFITATVLSILAFAFGLAGGIFALKRERIKLTVFAMSLLLTSGVAVMVAWYLLPFAIPVVILSIISIVFVSVSKSDFA